MHDLVRLTWLCRYVVSPPKPTNGDITLAVVVVQTTTTLSGITLTQYQSSSMVFTQGFAAAMARIVDPLTTGAVIASASDVIVNSVTVLTTMEVTTATTANATSEDNALTILEGRKDLHHQSSTDRRELATGGLIVTSSIRATNCNPIGFAALLLQVGGDPPAIPLDRFPCLTMYLQSQHDIT